MISTDKVAECGGAGMPRQIHFLHIGKTGGTSIIHALEPFQRGSQWKIVFHLHDVTLEQIPQGEAVMFALRDPVNRFVSGFNSRRRQGKPRYHSPWSPDEAIAFGAFATANDLANALSSPQGAVREQAEAAMRSIQHVRSGYSVWLKSVEYLSARNSDVLWVGRTERLAADFETLKQLLNLPANCALPSDPVLSHRRLDSDQTQLGAAGTKNIQIWYAADYEMLRHIFKVPAPIGVG